MGDRPPRVRVRVLGPFACTRDDEPVAVTGRLRSLLAVLAMSAGSTVGLERLTDGVWGQDPPAEPRRALQVYVNRLRSLLGAGLISTQPAGYRFEADVEDVDALTFERRAEEAAACQEPAARRRLIDGALRTWTGEPFESVHALPLHEVVGPRLREQWLRLVEQRADLLTEQHDPDQIEPLVAELEALTRTYPLREPLWERLLSALAAVGRGAEALDRYESVRCRLAEELGTDPGAGLRAVHARLLDTDDDPPRVPQQLLPDLQQFTGRHRALTQLDELLLPSGGETSGIVAITGQGGAGKTSLATHWAHRRRGEFPDGQLHLDLHGFSSQAPVEPRHALELLLRGLGVATEVIPASLAERSALLRTELSDRRALLVLDNARDAEQVRPLLPGGGSSAVVTSRSQLRGLTAREGVRPVALEAFAQDEALALLRETLGAARVDGEREAAEEIGRLCERLPLAVAVVSERATRVPAMALADLAEQLRDEHRRLERLAVGGDASSDIRAVFSLSYRVLDPRTARLFRLLSLLPDGPFDTASVAVLADLAEPDTAQLLDELAGSHLLQELGFGTYRMHDLLRAYAAQRCSEEDDAAHAEAAVARAAQWILASLDAAALCVRPGLPVLPAPDGALPGWPDHLPEPPTFASFPDAIAWFRDHHGALTGWVRRAAERHLHDYVWRLVVPLSLLLEVTEHREGAEAMADLGTAAAARVGDPSARYVMHDTAGRSYMRSRRLDDADASLEVALGAARELGMQRAEAAIVCSIGLLRRITGDTEEALRLQKQALSLVGPPDGSLLEVSLAAIQLNIGGSYFHLNAFAEAVTATRSGVDEARRAGDLWRQATGLNNLAVMLELVGEYGAAEDSCEEVVRLSERLRAPSLAFNALTARGRMLVLAGDRAGAARVWEDALRLLPATDNPQRAEVRTLLDKVRALERGSPR